MGIAKRSALDGHSLLDRTLTNGAAPALLEAMETRLLLSDVQILPGVCALQDAAQDAFASSAFNVAASARDKTVTVENRLQVNIVYLGDVTALGGTLETFQVNVYALASADAVKAIDINFSGPLYQIGIDTSHLGSPSLTPANDSHFLIDAANLMALTSPSEDNDKSFGTNPQSEKEGLGSYLNVVAAIKPAGWAQDLALAYIVARPGDPIIMYGEVANGSGYVFRLDQAGVPINFSMPVVSTTGQALSYTENAGAVAVDTGLTVSDADSLNLVSATVQITGNYQTGQDLLSFTNQLGITGSFNAGSGTLTLTGTASVADYQTALRSVRYTNTSENPSTLQRTVTFKVNDGMGESSAATRAINVTAVNDAPVNTVPGPQSTYQDTDLIFSVANGNLISVSDVDAGSSPVRVTLAGTNGVVTLAGTAGLTFTAGDGTADATMTFTGSLSDVNAALNGMKFTPSLGFVGSGSIQVATNDQGYSGSGGAMSDTDSVTIAALEATGAPTLTSIGTFSGASEDTAFTISYATLLAASDAACREGLTVSFRLQSVTSGTLAKGGSPTVPGTTIVGPGESFTWTPASNANGVLDAFVLRAWDGTYASVNAVQVKVNVAAVNDLPVVGSLSTSGNPVPQNVSLTLTANGVSDVEGAVAKVQFYYDTNGNGTLDVGTDELLGEDTSSAGGWTWTLAAPLSLPFGANRFFARAQDGEGAWGTSVSATTTVLKILTFGGRQKAQWQDANEEWVTVSLSGPGAGEVYLAGNDPGDALKIVVNDQSTVRSSLTISTKGRGSQTTVGEIVILGSLNSLTGKTTDLLGDLTVAGVLKKLTLDDVPGECVIDVGTVGNARDTLAITLDQVTDAVIVSQTPIKSLTVGQWLRSGEVESKVQAPWLAKLTSKSHFQAYLNLSGQGATSLTLGSALIVGNLTGVVWDITGSIGKLTVKGAVSGSTVECSGVLKAVRVYGATSGSLFDIGSTGNARDTLSLSFGQMTDSNILSDTPIKSLAVSQWLRSADSVETKVTAPWLAKLTSKSHFQADLELTGQGATKATLTSATIVGNLTGAFWDITGSLGKLTVKGAARDSTLRTTGNVTAVTLGASYGSDFLAGISRAVQRHAEEHDDFTSLARINSLKITGWKVPKGQTAPRYLENSNFSAASFGRIHIINPEPENYYEDFGIWARRTGDGKEITSLFLQDLESGDREYWKPTPGDGPGKVIGMLDLWISLL